MMNIVLDTQMIYHLSGISVNGLIDENKLKRILKDNTCYATSLSAIEIVSHFRNDLTLMRTALSPIFEKKYLSSKLILRDNILNIDDLRSLYLAPFPYNFGPIIEKIFLKKIQLESENLRFFLYLLLLAAILVIEDSENIDRLSLYKYFLMSKVDNILESLKSILKTGYDNDTVQQSMRNGFFNIYKKMFFSLLLFKHYHMNMDLINNIPEDDFEKIIQSELESDPLYYRMKFYEDNPISLLDKKSYKENLVGFLDVTLSTILNLKIPNKVNVDFILYKMSKILFESSVFKKNDIIDMLIISTKVIEENMSILTIDKNSYKFLLKIGDTTSTNLIESIFPMKK